MTRGSVLSRAGAGLALPLAAALASPAARAEMIDHGALEELFGEPVTTSATGQPQRVSQAPANMTIITAEDIRRSGARDIPGVLRHVGGVDILEWTQGDVEIGVRGYDQAFNSGLLVLIDGRQVYADHHGFTPWDVLPVELSAIRQIEVVKGPNAALFGFNAARGVINIVTYNPEMDDVGEASAFAGTQDLVGGSAVETLRLGDRVAVRLSVGAHQADGYDTPIPANIGSTRTRGDERRAASVDGVISFSDDVHLRLDASYAKADRNEIAPKLTMFGGEFTARSVQGRLTADTPAGLVEATAYTNLIRHMEDPLPPFGTFDFDNRVTVVRAQDLLTAGASHTLRVTAEARRNSVTTSPVTGGKIFYDVYSAGGMWDWKIASSLSLTNAVRFDRLELGRDGSLPAGHPLTNAAWDRTIEETSFNSGLVWRASEADTMRLTASRGAQLPSLITFGGLQALTPIANFIGLPTVDPTVVTSYEVGWDHKLDALDATVKASAFHEETEDVADLGGGLIISPDGVFFTPDNIGRSRSDGVELGVKGEVGETWRWGVDYRALRIDDDFGLLLNGQASTTNFEDTAPEHVVNAHLGWTGGRWEADGFVRYQSRVSGVLYTVADGPTLTPIPAHAALDARIGYALTDRATVAISGRNLGSDSQKQTSGPEVERSVMATLTVHY